MRSFAVILGAAVCVFAGQAAAAPFCLSIPGGGLQCLYYDGASCARDAARATNGACIANPQEIKLQSRSGGDYCLVTAQGASVCGYSDPGTCGHEALVQHGACVRAPDTLPQPLPNQYAPNAGR